jgi:hypothetical protein
MARRIAQPSIQIARRDPERHDFWLPFAVVLIAVSLLFVGSRHMTGLETEIGDAATETQLIKAFAKGGLERITPVTLLDPVLFEDPAALATTLERMAREPAGAHRSRYRVNTGAADPCPT